MKKKEHENAGKKGYLPRSESNMSAYDLNLDEGYTNYKEKLEDDHRRQSVSTASQNPSLVHSHRLDEGDDDIFGESGSFLPVNISQHLSQDNPWMKVLDDVSGMYYYFNTVTGESTWDRPADYIDKPEDQEISYSHDSQRNPIHEEPQSNQEEYHVGWDNVTLDNIHHHWNPQHDPNNDHQLQPNSSSPPPSSSSQYQSSQRQQTTMTTTVTRGDDSDDDNQPRVTRNKNIMYNAYGELYDSKHLIIDENSLELNKFLKMKKNGSLMRESLGWQEWLSAQGAIFYLKKGINIIN